MSLYLKRLKNCIGVAEKGFAQATKHLFGLKDITIDAALEIIVIILGARAGGAVGGRAAGGAQTARTGGQVGGGISAGVSGAVIASKADLTAYNRAIRDFWEEAGKCENGSSSTYAEHGDWVKGVFSTIYEEKKNSSQRVGEPDMWRRMAYSEIGMHRIFGYTEYP